MLLIRLMNLPRAYQSALALGIGLIAFAAPMALLTAVVLTLRGQSAELHDLRVRAGKLAVLAALKDDALNVLQQPAEGTNNALLISAESLPIAKANLQSRINAIVAAHGGSVASAGDVPDVSETGLLLIGMRADISGTNEAIEGILSEIEASKPPLLVREFVLRSEGAPPADRAPTLTASLRLYGATKPAETLAVTQDAAITEPVPGAVRP